MLVVEDDPYYFVSSNPLEVPRHIEREENYIYLNSFSKILSGEYRIGTMAGDYNIIKQMLVSIQNIG